MSDQGSHLAIKGTLFLAFAINICIGCKSGRCQVVKNVIVGDTGLVALVEAPETQETKLTSVQP